MTDYKATLNLPSTTFPMKANLALQEPVWLKRWQESNLYQCVRDAKRGRPSFNLHDGPIYANGSIHLGHAVNRILKDFIIRAKGLAGFDAPFIPGWDCHGLPIELQIEAQHPDASSMDRSLFNSCCREYAQQQIVQQKTSFMRLGLLSDWEKPYITMDQETVANTLEVLATVVDKGYLYRGFKPQYWCLNCQSALAEAEVEYQLKESTAVYFLCLCVDRGRLSHLQLTEAEHHLPISFVAWTTTPWTLFSNEALAVHPDHMYQLIRIEDRVLIVSADRAKVVLAKHPGSAHELLAEVNGSLLAGMTYAHPLLDRVKPVVLSQHVTREVGTGIVHIAPLHGLEDFEVGQRYQLPLEPAITRSGIFTKTVPHFEGRAILDSSTMAMILNQLEQKKRLWASASWSHNYPHCWRHQSPLIYLATQQWFIGLEQHQLRERALEAVQHVQWLPEWGSTRMSNMLHQRPDWCISRQRKWGVPLALFIHKKTGALHPRSASLLRTIADVVRKKGCTAWWDLPATTWIDEAEEYTRCTDILDVWFDSGATHTSVFEARTGVQSIDLYLEGSDQHRGWFMSSLLLGLICRQIAPYKTVLTHGFTVDQFGKKMSKSLGNVVEPMEIVNKYGSDVLRLWIASVDYKSEIVFSEVLLKRTVEAYRRIRNTIRFLLANLNFNRVLQKGCLPYHQLLLLDQWILSHASRKQAELIKQYETYSFNRVTKQILEFCSIDLGGFYLDIIKDRLYTMKVDTVGYHSAQTVLFHLLHALVRWIAPILPFTAEEAWSHIPGTDCGFVAMAEWYTQLPATQLMPFSASDWLVLRRLREVVGNRLEHLRRDKCIGSALDAELVLQLQPVWFEKLLPYTSELHFFFMTSRVVLQEQTLSQDATTEEIGTFQVKPLKGKKCPRCWHRVKELRVSETMGELCERCIENTVGFGEKRIFS